MKFLYLKEYLEKLVKLAGKVKKPTETAAYPPSLDTQAKRALYDNLDHDEVLAVQIDTAVRYVKKSDWRGHRFKEREVLNAIREELGGYEVKAKEIFELVKNQRDY